jgi:hypothetical protein
LEIEKMPKNHETGKNARGRPPSDTTPLQLRLPNDVIAALEKARHSFDVIPSRQEILRIAATEWLKGKGFLK